MSLSKWLSAGALAMTFALAPAQAGPAPQTGLAEAAKADSAVTPVHRRHHHHHRHGHWGGGVGLGLGLGIIGGIIASEAYRPRAGYYYDEYEYDGPYYYPSSYSGDPRVICAQNFRSFEWRTGLYTTYSGEKRVCPYLR